jgi:hypothetical protein
MCLDYCDWGTRGSNGVAKVSVLLWRYADHGKVITSDIEVRADLDRHGFLRSGTSRGINSEV